MNDKTPKQGHHQTERPGHRPKQAGLNRAARRAQRNRLLLRLLRKPG